MKRNVFVSRFAATMLLLSSGIGVNLFPLMAPTSVQAAGEQVNTMQGCFLNVPFTGTIVFNPTNIRQQPTTNSPIVGKFTQIGQAVQFSGIATGTGAPVNDAWGAGPDNMWYRLADGRGWVASAVIKGYPPRCAGIANGKAEKFFQWAVGQRGITRYDRNDLNGQCVTLVIRYLQDVYFGGDRSARAYGHGKDVARGVANSHPNLFQYKTSGTPKRGAIISFLGAGYDSNYGHVAIVMETSGNSIKILESNHDGRGTQSVVRISDWKNRAGVVGWADPTGNLP